MTEDEVQGSGNVLVVGEAGADGSARPISWEMLTAARQVASGLGRKRHRAVHRSRDRRRGADVGQRRGRRVLIADDEDLPV